MRHLDEGELLRYVDGELGPADTQRWEAHVAACERCDRAVETVMAESRRLSDWLTRADFEADLGPASLRSPLAAATAGGPATVPGARRGQASTPVAVPPPRRHGARPASTAWLKAAIIVLLVAAPLAAFPGVRGWVVQQVGLADTGEAPAIEATSAAASPVVRFEPAPGTFTVRLQAGIDDGALTLARTAETGAVEAVLRMDGTAEPVVAERVLRIVDAQPGTRLTLTLPAAVTDVRIFVGTREIRVTGEELETGRTVALGG